MTMRFLHTLAELGPAATTWYALARLLRYAGVRMFRYQFVAQRVPASPMRRSQGNLAIESVAGLHELPAPYPRPLAVVAARFRQGGNSIAAWKGKELAGILWYQFGAYQEDEVRVRYCLPSPHACWDYDVFIQPHLRGGTAFCRLWDEANRRMHARGIRWTCSRISLFNPGSLRAHLRLGAVPMGRATFLGLGRWQIMLASLPPYLHVSSGPHSWPQLVFDTDALNEGAPPCPAT